MGTAGAGPAGASRVGPAVPSSSCNPAGGKEPRDPSPRRHPHPRPVLGHRRPPRRAAAGRARRRRDQGRAARRRPVPRLRGLPVLEPQPALRRHRPQGSRSGSTSSSGWRPPPTPWSSPSARACSTASAWAGSGSTRSTRSLVLMSCPPYPAGHRRATRPGYDALVQASSGQMTDQPGWRNGPDLPALPGAEHGGDVPGAERPAGRPRRPRPDRPRASTSQPRCSRAPGCTRRSCGRRRRTGAWPTTR